MIHTYSYGLPRAIASAKRWYVCAIFLNVVLPRASIFNQLGGNGNDRAPVTPSRWDMALAKGEI